MHLPDQDLPDLTELAARLAAADAAVDADPAALKRAGALEALLRLHSLPGVVLPTPDSRLLLISPARLSAVQLAPLAPDLRRVFGVAALAVEELSVLLLAPVVDDAAAEQADDAAYAAWCAEQIAADQSVGDRPYAPDREPSAPDRPAEPRHDPHEAAFRTGFQLGRLTLVAGELPGEWRQAPDGGFELHLARDAEPAEAHGLLVGRQAALCEALGWTACTFGGHGHVLTVYPDPPHRPEP